MSTITKITQLLDSKRISQKDLTDYLGIDKSTFSQWKNGKSQSFNKYIYQIAKFLETTPSDLMGWKDKSVSQGEKIRLLREQMGLSQSDLALKTGYSLESIIKYENNEQKISDTVRHKFIEALQIDEDLLPHCGGYFDFRDDIDIAIAKNAWYLNDIGKRKVLEYISDLINTGKYNKEE